MKEQHPVPRSWGEVWGDRRDDRDGGVLDRMLRLDGFDHSAGSPSPDDWQQYVLRFGSRLGLRPGSRVFEVGCGAGAFLYPFHGERCTVAGCDYSPVLTRAAGHFMPEGDFFLQEAEHLGIRAKADVVVSHSVFQYFPDLPYAERVVHRMLRKARGVVAILDVPDLALRSRSQEARRAAGIEGRDTSRGGLSHLYYARDFFRRIGEQAGVSVSIEDQRLRGYLNAPFRFHVFLERP